MTADAASEARSAIATATAKTVDARFERDVWCRFALWESHWLRLVARIPAVRSTRVVEEQSSEAWYPPVDLQPSFRVCILKPMAPVLPSTTSVQTCASRSTFFPTVDENIWTKRRRWRLPLLAQVVEPVV